MEKVVLASGVKQDNTAQSGRGDSPHLAWDYLKLPRGAGAPQRWEEGTVCSTTCGGMDEWMDGRVVGWMSGWGAGFGSRASQLPTSGRQR